MLSDADNDLLTRVSAGTPLGDFIRSFWVPALMSSELPEPDGPPLRVRILGEPLVAFRNSDGQVALLGEHCPHRRASLRFGRNEGGGIRCVYHGWKFNLRGECVELPTESPSSNLRHKVKAKAYPCVERGGTVWAYMGGGNPPGVPEFEWTLVGGDQRYVTKRLLDCNWAQALEGDIDSSHASFLHSHLEPVDHESAEAAPELRYFANDRHPVLESVETEFGLSFAARRTVDEENYYWRLTHYVFPYFVMIAPFGDQLLHANIWLPVDDHRTMVWSIDWHPKRALLPAEYSWRDSGLGFHCKTFGVRTADAGSEWAPRQNALNDYELDYELQRETMYSGIEPLWCQDKAVQESMGTIVDRKHEHLLQSDFAIIRWRRRLLSLLKDGLPDQLPGRDSATHRIRPLSAVLRQDADWTSTLRGMSAIS